MSLSRRKFRAWVCRKTVCLTPAETFGLYHVARHAHALHLVSKLSFSSNDPDDRADELERQVTEEVTDHIEAWPGRQQYVVRAYDEEGGEVGEYPFSMSAQNTRTESAEVMLMPTPRHGAIRTAREWIFPARRARHAAAAAP